MKSRGTDHIIKKQVLEIQYPAEEDGYAFQHKLEKLVWENLVPIMDRACNKLSSGGAVHQIERLEIELGELKLGQLGEQLQSAFEAQFYRQLNAAIQRTYPSGSSAPVRQKPGQAVVEEGGPAFMPPGYSESRQGEAISGANSDWQLFQYFMATGLLPWWADAGNKELLKDTADRLIESVPGLLRQYLPRWWQRPQQRIRLISQLPDSVLIALAESFLTTDAPGSFLKILNEISSYLSVFAQRKAMTASRFRVSFWTEVFYCLVQSPPQVDYLVTRAKKMLGVIKGEGTGEVTGKKQTFGDEAPLEQNRAGEEEFGFNASASKKMGEEISGDEIQPFFSNEADATAFVKAPFKDVEAFHDSDEIYTGNSGLVLLWPFLQQFFVEQGLVEDKRFVSEAAQFKAAYLLQAMVEGPGEYPEFLLPLNKILCGVPLTAPIILPDAFKETDYANCEAFLEQVVATAPILHNMSVEGFRNTFLMREGMLVSHPQQWQLSVNRETYDLVLSRFPWPFNFVKLPWMEKMIAVEW